ncbi:MAG: hypothetical protein J6A75_06195 [Lachnospiraceae bacterium]|nr:hypothetical protein [Lachnospiraceae bacterium]
MMQTTNTKKTLSPLANALHERFQSELLNEILTGKRSFNYTVPTIDLGDYKTYTSLSTCKTAIRECIEPKYHQACAFFSPDNPASTAADVATYYSKILNQSISPILAALYIFCQQRQQLQAYEELVALIKNSDTYFIHVFTNHLANNPQAYCLPALDYFLDIVPIEEFEKTSPWDIFTFCFKRKKSSTVFELDDLDICRAIEKINSHMIKCHATFRVQVLPIYKNYIEKIESLVDSISTGLPEFFSDEKLTDYLKRVA